MSTSPDDSRQQAPKLDAAGQPDPDGMAGFEGFAEGFIAKHPAAFERSPAHRALYGEDRERELADLEAGAHPLLTPAR